MKSIAHWILILTCAVAFAGPQGTVPKGASSEYARHVDCDGVSVGATLLTPEQARKTFVSDVNRCCAIVEVGFYPGQGKTSDVSLNDFVLRVTGSETAAKPSSAKVIAATLQKKSSSDRDVAVSPHGGVGYESGSYDPVTGRTGGMYEQLGVGVSTHHTNAGSTEKDRGVMETELSEKGLPEGTISEPVAGYLYFPITPRKKGTAFQLECVVNGQRVLLALP